ncbi:MAG: hypothetical protein PHG72_06800 [Candidatus Omnitrophica bacterium]|nr:hypothetical protein [Candidatus Omnitrophota bacterium]
MHIFKIFLTLLEIFLVDLVKLLAELARCLLVTGLHGLTDLIAQVFFFLSGSLGVLLDLIVLPF